MSVTRIRPTEIFEFWSQMREQVGRALKYGKGETDLSHILNRLQSGVYQGWEHDGSYAVTRLVDFDNYRVCRVLYAGGKMEDEKPIREEIEDWAKSVGCRAVEIIGRPGWERVTGYERYSVISRKELENATSLL